MQIPVARPVIGPDEVAAVSDVLMSGMLAQGEKVAEFEQKFAAYCGTAHAVAVNNGTAALHAALLAAGIGPGDEVIVPAFSFIATATAVSMCGAKPVFADVDEQTFNIRPDQVNERITPKTKAVIGVHLFGQPFDVGSRAGDLRGAQPHTHRGCGTGPRCPVSWCEGGKFRPVSAASLSMPQRT